MKYTELSAEEYLESYQYWVDSVNWSTVKGNKEWAVLALVSEAGEFAQLHEKLIRKGKIYDEEVKSELGDILWNVANICNQYDLKMSDVLEYNVDKIEKRRRDAASKKD